MTSVCLQYALQVARTHLSHLFSHSAKFAVKLFTMGMNITKSSITSSVRAVFVAVIELLKFNFKEQIMKCKICGKEFEYSPFMNDALCSGRCFTENFWNVFLDDTAIIIDGRCYHDCGEAPEGLRGYDGCTFHIRKNDGTLIITNNLRYNGIVPKERNVPDNACFVEAI